MIKLRLIILIIVISVARSVDAQPKAVFIIVDGIPADVIEKLKTPVLTEISKAGGYTRAYVGGEKDYRLSPTISAVGYNHLLTGTWTNKHNVWDNDIVAQNYNYWSVFRILKTVKPELKTAVFSTWTDNRTKLIGEGLLATGSMKMDYAYDGFELDTITYPHTKDSKHIFNIDEKVSTEAGRYIEENGPDLSWVYLEFTDDMGHQYGDSPQFYEAIKSADTQIGRIWTAIKARQKKYNEDWMIVITTDHGRDVETGKEHGGQSDRERTTWMVTNSKKLNSHFKDQPAVIDIAPSILDHLNITIPDAQRAEIDGASFVGPLSLVNLKAVKQQNKIDLSWNVVDPKGKAEILLATTNHFKEGGEDQYTSLGKINVSDKKFSIDLSKYPSAFYKILIKGPHNWQNIWVQNP